jgi:hypothetical protein
MKKVASSPNRHTFQKERAIQRAEEAGKKPSQSYIDMWYQIKINEANKINDPKWQKDNLEYDLRSSKELCDKAKASNTYAQNLYAAMCNNDFAQNKVWPLLKNQTWSCSWRHAGGIVADMCEHGDYIDWYCSGIGNEESGYGLDHRPANGYVPEGVVTDEIQKDLFDLGWIVVDQKEDI